MSKFIKGIDRAQLEVFCHKTPFKRSFKAV